jgi:zinc/manganese transport system substrate-binding protein
MRYLLLFFFSFLVVSANAEPAPAHKITVVASFSILGDMVREVGGDHVSVITLVGPDGDAHVYSPIPNDAATLSTAKLVIVNGLGFEGWLDRLVKSSDYQGRVVVASHGVKALTTSTGSIDPHAWQSISNGKIYVNNIRDALVDADPENAASYRANAIQYQKELDALSEWVRMQIKTVPEAKRIAITSHDALGYFSHEYDVTFIAPLGVSTEGDASAGDVAKLIDQIRSSHIRAVFMENMTDPRLVKQLVSDGGAVIGGTLYSDALSAPDGVAPTYAAMFRHNVLTMVKTLKDN